MTLTITKNKPDTAPADAVKRAVLYLRVSSRDQLETDYDDDGLSIAAQRERVAQKAAEYSAVVIDEYIERAESAKTNDRPALNTMLKRIKEQRDVDYVIVWKVDRFARNRRDDANMLFEIELAGARLISATENIDQTPAGRLMHGMLASFAEYYSRNLANEVLKGATEKAKRGGTPGRARLGYLNTREQLPQGGEVRTIVIDPERGPIVTWAFETYATGLYSLADMAVLLEVRGLRSRGDRRRSPQPLNLSRVHRAALKPLLRRHRHLPRQAVRGTPPTPHQPGALRPSPGRPPGTLSCRRARPQAPALPQGHDPLRHLRLPPRLLPPQRQRWPLRILRMPTQPAQRMPTGLPARRPRRGSHRRPLRRRPVQRGRTRGNPEGDHHRPRRASRHRPAGDRPLPRRPARSQGARTKAPEHALRRPHQRRALR